MGFREEFLDLCKRHGMTRSKARAKLTEVFDNREEKQTKFRLKYLKLGIKNLDREMGLVRGKLRETTDPNHKRVLNCHIVNLASTQRFYRREYEHLKGVATTMSQPKKKVEK